MIQAMLPFLQASQRPRIVNVASATASLALAGDPNSMFSREATILACASSKAAVSMLDDLTSHSEVVNCVVPPLERSCSKNQYRHHRSFDSKGERRAEPWLIQLQQKS
jgi:NAD(P)-dependent dehydrogenase (short-subunit alcohol dehydrogenase family)